ncbi:MAG: DUF2809 domain-containing protein [Sphingomonas sp.]|uniref:ribosomal maturation YjgA family protein n=1 Tax=Sphingomonas sp. TaxID=28214 RepID=UPI0025DB5E30|nr:DUF2809 domain-containing protein [Sphingomonas sp.]MBX3564703.1 DUF2809 domain-containing protein [Sphingomonas sp.]
MRLHRGYALLALALFLVEVLIALFVRDNFVRPYLGDTIAVILVYAGLRTAFRIGRIPAAATAFLVAVAIEFGQYFRILDWIGLADNRIARIVLGTGFAVEDFFAYAAGALIVLAVEAVRSKP